MSEETIVAVFDTEQEASAVVRDLEAAGVPATSISRHARDTVTTGSTGVARPRESGFWSSLFGSESDTEGGGTVYDRSIESGGAVVSVRADEAYATRVTEIIERHNPIDIDERAKSYGLHESATTARTGSMAGTADARAIASGVEAGGAERLSLSEERLAVGKRAVNRGTTRIHRFVVETPVEESITLRDETVSIERHPVEGDRAVGAAEPDFTDKVIEVTETDEEAVVSKTARVREEVVINKTATERTETVRDTVRREDVRIDKDGVTAREAVDVRQPVPAGAGAATSRSS